MAASKSMRNIGTKNDSDNNSSISISSSGGGGGEIEYDRKTGIFEYNVSPEMQSVLTTLLTAMTMMRRVLIRKTFT